MVNPNFITLLRGQKPPLFCILLVISIFFYPTTPQAETYLPPEDFINNSFNGNPPATDVLWINKSLRQQAEKILAHKPGFLRTRYRKQDSKSVWILDEIGKTKPITVGIVINQGKIETVKVLSFRESRGWEVKHDFFTKQYINAQLKDDLQLNQNIDGISGATLSVRAVTKLAKLALLFDQEIRQ
ncbi:MAG: FMN-binding protein [Gammaproteobacteria bacterium]|nr:MAG: FMN-binding protein [Gammaproteobacteria bacterium]